MSSTVTHLETVGSTNDWLLARAETLGDGHWVIADRQTAGRGRRGRVWDDGAGNLMASVLVRAEGAVQQLSFVAAIALLAALRGQGGDGVSLDFARDERWGDRDERGGDRFKLKWPNDVLLDGVKVSGILLERAGDALVIGFGVNIASAPVGTERPATSFVAAGLEAVMPTILLGRLIPAFAEYRRLWATQGFEPVRARWLAAAAGVGDRIAARLGAETLEGVFEGIGADGALALRLDDGGVRAVHAGEVFAL